MRRFDRGGVAGLPPPPAPPTMGSGRRYAGNHPPPRDFGPPPQEPNRHQSYGMPQQYPPQSYQQPPPGPPSAPPPVQSYSAPIGQTTSTPNFGTTIPGQVYSPQGEVIQQTTLGDNTTSFQPSQLMNVVNQMLPPVPAAPMQQQQQPMQMQQQPMQIQQQPMQMQQQPMQMQQQPMQIQQQPMQIQQPASQQITTTTYDANGNIISSGPLTQPLATPQQLTTTMPMGTQQQLQPYNPTPMTTQQVAMPTQQPMAQPTTTFGAPQSFTQQPMQQQFSQPLQTTATPQPVTQNVIGGAPVVATAQVSVPVAQTSSLIQQNNGSTPGSDGFDLMSAFKQQYPELFGNDGNVVSSVQVSMPGVDATTAAQLQSNPNFQAVGQYNNGTPAIPSETQGATGQEQVEAMMKNAQAEFDRITRDAEQQNLQIQQSQQQIQQQVVVSQQQNLAQLQQQNTQIQVQMQQVMQQMQQPQQPQQPQQMQQQPQQLQAQPLASVPQPQQMAMAPAVQTQAIPIPNAPPQQEVAAAGFGSGGGAGGFDLAKSMQIASGTL